MTNRIKILPSAEVVSELLMGQCTQWVESCHLTPPHAARHLARMVNCLSYRSPSIDEITVNDEAAEQAAREMLEEDAAGFRCSLSNPRVSRLGDMTIVRMDLCHDDFGENVGLAMSIEQAGRFSLGVFID